MDLCSFANRDRKLKVNIEASDLNIYVNVALHFNNLIKMNI